MANTCRFKKCKINSMDGYMYCTNHKCWDTDCNDLKNLTGKFCINHTCNYKDCYTSKEFNTHYCQMHLCADAHCINSILCPLIEFCSVHLPSVFCNIIGCKERVSFNNVCDTHKCKYEFCVNSKEPFQQYCANHKCIKCSNMIAKPYARQCINHKCHSPTCGMDISADDEEIGYGSFGSNDSKFCDSHTCRTEDCVKYAYMNGLCYEHLIVCSDIDCENQTQNIFMEYCNSHTCDIPGCRLRKSAYSDLCYMHKYQKENIQDIVLNCHYKNCNDSHVMCTKFCKNHLCIAAECIEASADDADYCVYHTCFHDSCNNRRIDKYCTKHM
jgi:hypothetical protein